MIAFGDVGLGGLAVGLLDEAGDAEAAVAFRMGFRPADVAVPGLRALRRHADGHERPGPCRHGAALGRIEEGGNVTDDVIGGKHQEHRVRILGGDDQSGDGGGGRGVAAEGFENDVARRNPDLTKLLGDDEAMLGVADDERRQERVLVADALDRLLQERGLRHQRQQLLRIELPRQGPQPRAGAPGQDHRLNLPRSRCWRPHADVSAAAPF